MKQEVWNKKCGTKFFLPVNVTANQVAASGWTKRAEPSTLPLADEDGKKEKSENHSDLTSCQCAD